MGQGSTISVALLARLVIIRRTDHLHTKFWITSRPLSGSLQDQTGSLRDQTGPRGGQIRDHLRATPAFNPFEPELGSLWDQVQDYLEAILSKPPGFPFRFWGLGPGTWGFRGGTGDRHGTRFRLKVNHQGFPFRFWGLARGFRGRGTRLRLLTASLCQMFRRVPLVLSYSSERICHAGCSDLLGPLLCSLEPVIPQPQHCP